jgi:hypothetical protein
VLAIAAAMLVLAGATVAAVRLIELLAEATPGTSVVVDEGVVFNERQVQGDYAITLERGYADINQVVVVLSIERADRSGPVDVDMFASLVDPAGHVLDRGTAGPDFGVHEGDARAHTFSFAPATSNEGDYTLQATTGAAAPVWTFMFPLPEPIGEIVAVDETVERNGTAVYLGEVRLSPTMISARIGLQPSEPDMADWATIGHLRHDARTFRLAWESGTGDGSGGSVIGTVEGTDPAAGEWTLVITELVGERTDESQVRLPGPWEFTFDVP